MTKPWFRLNKLKIGWVPVTWQGWLLIIGYIAFTVYNFIRIDRTAHAVSDTLINFIPQTVLFTGFLSVLCYFTSEKSADKNMLD